MNCQLNCLVVNVYPTNFAVPKAEETKVDAFVYRCRMFQDVQGRMIFLLAF